MIFLNQDSEEEEPDDYGDGEGVGVGTPIEIERDVDGHDGHVEEVNINHCNQNNDDNRILYASQCSAEWTK